jgi:hypothetical protein
MDHAGKFIADKDMDPPIAIEPFNAEIQGLYTLKLLNPTDQVLETAIGFRQRDNNNNFRRHINSTTMKQFADIGDLLQ